MSQSYTNQDLQTISVILFHVSFVHEVYGAPCVTNVLWDFTIDRVLSQMGDLISISFQRLLYLRLFTKQMGYL